MKNIFQDGLRRFFSLILNKQKKASADIWWVIIGAVLALIVLIVLLVSFTGKTQTLSGELSACEGKGGVCVAAVQSCPSGTLKTKAFACSQEGNCCLGNPQECLLDGACDSGSCSVAVLNSDKRYCA